MTEPPFEQFDEFFNVNRETDYDQYICSTDMDQFHGCNSKWETLSWKEKGGLITVKNKCGDCGETFKSTYIFAFTETYEERDE
jgi:hypothetical protein